MAYLRFNWLGDCIVKSLGTGCFNTFYGSRVIEEIGFEVFHRIVIESKLHCLCLH